MHYEFLSQVKYLCSLKCTHSRDLLSPESGDWKSDTLSLMAKTPHPPPPPALCSECEHTGWTDVKILIFTGVLFLHGCRYFIHVPALEKRLPVWYPITEPTTQLCREVLQLIEQKQYAKFLEEIKYKVFIEVNLYEKQPFD